MEGKGTLGGPQTRELGSSSCSTSASTSGYFPLSSSFGFKDFVGIVMSSRQRANIESWPAGMSLVYVEYSIGDKMLAWGCPARH